MGKNSFSGEIAIAGIHEYESRWAPDKTAFQIMGECTREALDDAGLTLSDVDGVFGATMAMGAMGMVQLSEYLNIKPRYMDGSNIGGSSFVSHVAHAAAAIHFITAREPGRPRGAVFDHRRRLETMRQLGDWLAFSTLAIREGSTRMSTAPARTM